MPSEEFLQPEPYLGAKPSTLPRQLHGYSSNLAKIQMHEVVRKQSESNWSIESLAPGLKLPGSLQDLEHKENCQQVKRYRVPKIAVLRVVFDPFSVSPYQLGQASLCDHYERGRH